MKTCVLCLCLLVMGVWPADFRAQERENPWAVSLSAGYGYDLQQLSRKYANDYPLTINYGNGAVWRIQMGDPLILQLGVTVPLGNQIGIETGFGLTSRNLRYWDHSSSGGDEGCTYCTTRLKVRQFRVPLLVDLIPLHDAQRKWRMHLKGGLSVDWSGNRDEFRSNGPASTETPSKVEVVDLADNATIMFLVYDEELTASLLAGVEWEKSFGKVGRLGFGITFSRQLTSSTSLLFWGYNRELDTRAGGYFPNTLQFTSLGFNLRYVFAL